MKKSMIMMCISAMLGLCIPAMSAEAERTPPVRTEVRVVNQADVAKNEENTPKEVTPVNNENGDESTASATHGGGYVVISGAGLLLLIILLIILL
jgi:hypothetical protein